MGLPKIKTATQVRSELFKTLQEVLKGQTQIITHKDGDSVLISKEKYEDLLDKVETLQSLSRGLKDLAENRFYEHDAVVSELRKHMKK